MQIQVGTIAPDFQTQDIFGKPINLKGYSGSPILLSFFRNAACAICNLRVHQLSQRFQVYNQAGLKIIAVFESPRENMLEYVGKQDAPFPLIADPQAQLYDLYGVEVSEDKIALSMERAETHATVQEAAKQGFPLTKEEGSNFYRMPADFLISPTLKIEQVHYAEFVNDHLPLELIEQFLGITATR